MADQRENGGKKVLEGKIILSENVGAYNNALQRLRGAIDTDALLREAQVAMNILDQSEEFGTANDWMVFFSAFKTYGIQDLESLNRLHQANKSKSAGKSTEISRKKLEEKFDIMRRASRIVMAEFKGNKKALDYGIIVRTTQYSEVTKDWVVNFAMAFPPNKVDHYSKLAFSVIGFVEMERYIRIRTGYFLKMVAFFNTKGKLELKNAGSSYMGRNLLTKAWAFKETETEWLLANFNLNKGLNIEEQKEFAKNLTVEDLYGDAGKELPKFLRMLACGMFDVRKLKQSPTYKIAQGADKKGFEAVILSWMLSVMNVVEDQGGKWDGKNITLDVNDPFTIQYYRAFSVLSNTHTCFIQKLFPRAGSSSVFRFGDLDGNYFKLPQPAQKVQQQDLGEFAF